MADVRIANYFRKSTNGGDKSETYRIVSVDTRTGKVVVEVSKEINGEAWKTERLWEWNKTQSEFHNNAYEYI